ncbi:TonB-dependent receptor [Aestuariivivens sediminis]|uniref:TonB-dependent receptor n=1 Tax=Aestuariivivens sediminis TaxID=2913557 RepID=UPI001F573D4D|nr:TonB-dependent receptor [Aestuariivivens sediminis]
MPKLNLLTSIIFFFSMATLQVIQSQTIINGKVTSVTGMPIPGANIYLQGTYDGATSLDDGTFSFLTHETGTQTLIISYLSFQTCRMMDEVLSMRDLSISLRENVNALDAVVLSAGTFHAGDHSKINVLKPLDVVTTASALGDFIGALQTLPGTTTVAEDGRLFVRGGQARETQIFIDGIRVFTPYTPTTNNTPTRGRYSPFLFDGITFSTGGYSAEYGQALSGVLLLNTINEPDQEKTDVGLMSLGVKLGNTQKWRTGSLSVNMSYINLAPYNAILPNRNQFIKPYESVSGESVFRRKTRKGLFKLYGAYDSTNFELIQEDINKPEGLFFKLDNQNAYFNGSYGGVLGEAWSMHAGLSYTRAKNKRRIDDRAIAAVEKAIHAKIKFKNHISNYWRLYFGAEYLTTDFNEPYGDAPNEALEYGFRNDIAAAFVETDIFVSKDLAFKAGLRSECSALLNDFSLVPRVSLALKTSSKSQLSLAYGSFFQTPSNHLLKFNTNFKPQNAKHYILNYQHNSNGRLFRAEAYFKSYDNLAKYDSDIPRANSYFTSDGKAYARGIDFFWRDSESLRHVDYWMSYSLLDTRRNDDNYPKSVQPSYVNTHNLSLVGKYWINKWRSQVGLSYSFASGRPYTNPNRTGFLNAKTRAYNNLSLNWAYLISQQKIVYASVNNVLGFKNINGYQYATSPDVTGHFNRRALQPAADQFFFVGFFWTISDDKNRNQLDNL